MSKLFSLSLTLLLAGISVESAAGAAASCQEKSVSATAIRTREDIQSFVQCAHEYVQEMGAAEAYRAFHEDERWKSGAHYIFVTKLIPTCEPIVFPPDQSREDSRILLEDTYGSDACAEIHRVAKDFGVGWVYYAFTNPATGREEPKMSFVKRIDWDGTLVVIGAGIYLPDLPGTCDAAQVNARMLAMEPSQEKLKEFVRCASLLVESYGYFAVPVLQNDPRWNDSSIYLFGIDPMGNQLFSGNRSKVNGSNFLEWGADPTMSPLFSGRDPVSMALAFGEASFYYDAINPVMGNWQRKVGFVKRVTAYGVPVLVGSGIYLNESSSPGVVTTSGVPAVPVD